MLAVGGGPSPYWAQLEGKLWGWGAPGCTSSSVCVTVRLSGSWLLTLGLSEGVSTSNLSDGILVIHVSPEANKQKVIDGHQSLLT